MFRLLLAFSLTAGAFGEIANINSAVDVLLEVGKTMLDALNGGKIVLPDLNHVTEHKLLGAVVFSGEFHASGGSLSDLRTIKRTGDVTLESKGDDLILTASLGMDMLAVDYEKYHVVFEPLNSEGSIHAASARNSLTLVLVVVKDGDDCKINLDRATLDDIGAFDIKLNGPGDLNKLGSILFPWILNQFNKLVKEKINHHLGDILKKAVGEANICKEIYSKFAKR
ncbi:Hypothetical protein NTJ_11144 [Nesidiocoris tenuis]|uniref:Lipid-binding serum glycoprotein N-terminal domain-containing protein n=1 Tax=Nesidiocoris tenuis TaxID=355587 RepID=A0ABN7B3A0_9HEMI|nr:Hypothetical protein NTJ_11144 [Nesidiocoris tenuis]